MTEYPGPYEAYLIEFHATRDYFECHELLEAYWKSLPPNEPDRDVWVGLIQVAVAQYHHRRGNAAGALKMFLQAERRLRPEPLARLGLDGDALRAMVAERIAALASAGERTAFREFDLPIADRPLLMKLRRTCEAQGLAWGAPSKPDDALLRRHALRDRSDVIEARAAAAARRRKERES